MLILTGLVVVAAVLVAAGMAKASRQRRANEANRVAYVARMEAERARRYASE